jgi:hypothetical protein
MIDSAANENLTEVLNDTKEKRYVDSAAKTMKCLT